MSILCKPQAKPNLPSGSLLHGTSFPPYFPFFLFPFPLFTSLIVPPSFPSYSFSPSLLPIFCITSLPFVLSSFFLLSPPSSSLPLPLCLHLILFASQRLYRAKTLLAKLVPKKMKISPTDFCRITKN